MSEVPLYVGHVEVTAGVCADKWVPARLCATTGVPLS
jgi:hypothetical protein